MDITPTTNKNKKIIEVIVVSIAILIGVIGFVFGSIAIHDKSRMNAHKEPPTCEQVEKEMEFWLVSDEIVIHHKTVYQDYIVYYALDNNRRLYYEVVYVLESDNAFDHHWEYSHWVPSDHSSWQYGN